LETARRPPWENPPAFGFEIFLSDGVSAGLSKKTPDHLAVIQPPTTACLTARWQASGPLAFVLALARWTIELPQLYRLSDGSANRTL
jgi:hypothetical protein